jgi:cobyrinic acid a,c-diamide synthase
MKKDIFPMRHLGMIPHQEYLGSEGAISFLADICAESVDMAAVQAIMGEVTLPEAALRPASEKTHQRNSVKIGIIQDAAFQFYYAENLAALEQEGAQLIPINALRDSSLPRLDGLYIGGGFPETSATELAANRQFRESVRQAAEDGLPIYAECGGLIYLGKSIVLEDREHLLAGVFPVRFGMSAKPQAHGYTIFEVERHIPFYAEGTVVKGHEFRYSTVLEWQGEESELVLKMKRGKGFAGGRDGLHYNNVLALYTHVHACGTPEWAKGFVGFCRERKRSVPEL